MPMQLSLGFLIAAIIAVAVLLVGAWCFKSGASRKAKRPIVRGPSNMRFICARCSGQFTHTKRTVSAWEKGSRKVFCDACHKNWRNAQPPRAQSNRPTNQARPESKSGCLGVCILVVAIPVALIALAAHAS